MNEKQTFSMCLKQGIAVHAHLIAEIGELASKEYVIEQALDRMAAEWASRPMEVTPFKNTGTNVFNTYSMMVCSRYRYKCELKNKVIIMPKDKLKELYSALFTAPVFG